jgi:3-phosphoshikimate 1-carboxyvinyltransferase
VNITLPKMDECGFRVAAPPSKSYTHRALVISALADGVSEIKNPLDSGDTRVTLRALRALGTDIEEAPELLRVWGCSGHFPIKGQVTIDMENSGTSFRLLTAAALLCRKPVIFTGSPRMQERPVGYLVDALNSVGGRIRYLGNSGYPPVLIEGRLSGGAVTIPGTISSQFISALMISAPYAESDIDVQVTGDVASRSYLDITSECMEQFGVKPVREGYHRFRILSGTGYEGRSYTIEGDYSSASYFFAIAAVLGGWVEVEGLNPQSVQGDRRFVEALGRMGCKVTYRPDAVRVERTGDLRGITMDMSSSPDTVQTLCMVAAMASTPSLITGISHLKYKESDRVKATADLLNGLGGHARVNGNGISITPSPLHGGDIDPGDDHRTAMSAAVLALTRGDITIRNAECVDKSFPHFFDSIRGISPD